MKVRLLWLGGALALASCAAPLRAVPASLDPSNPEGPEGAEPPLAAPAAEPPLPHAHPGHAAPVPPALAPPAQTEERYTCPMHPEVVQAAAGRCPKCGMTLVPRKALPADPAPAPTPRPPGHGPHGAPAGGTS